MGRSTIVVAQLGARRHYLVPVALQSVGILDHFYTDLYAGVGGLTAALETLAQLSNLSSIKRFVGRRDERLPADKVTSFPIFGLQYKARARIATKRSGYPTSAWLWGGRRFAQLVARKGFGPASSVYAYSSAAFEVFERAASEGINRILDHATAPRLLEQALTRQQEQRFPGWAQESERQDEHLVRYAERQEDEARLASTIICGSSFVKRMVDQRLGCQCKSVVVPLGLRLLPQGMRPKRIPCDRPLRLLFVGDEAMRKGIGDMVEAIKLFGPARCEARAAGNVDLSDLGKREVGKVVTLLGAVPRAEMRAQYEWSDVCILPSVSDTFGLVILEALSHGVPVITTPNTGAVDAIENGKEGFIVPIMAPEAIAQKLTVFDEDRNLLERMSETALAATRQFDLQAYSSNLVAVLRRRHYAGGVGASGL